MYLYKDDRYSVECQTKIAENCCKQGAFCDSEEEAWEWVEEECWIFSGEGWICIRCHEHFMSQLYKARVVKGVAEKEAKAQKKEDEDGTELYKGIDTVL